jgi:hypothetical protein
MARLTDFHCQHPTAAHLQNQAYGVPQQSNAFIFFISELFWMAVSYDLTMQNRVSGVPQLSNLFIVNPSTVLVGGFGMTWRWVPHIRYMWEVGPMSCDYLRPFLIPPPSPRLHTTFSLSFHPNLGACSVGLSSAYFGFLHNIFLLQQISRTYQHKSR